MQLNKTKQVKRIMDRLMNQLIGMPVERTAGAHVHGGRIPRRIGGERLVLSLSRDVAC